MDYLYKCEIIKEEDESPWFFTISLTCEEEGMKDKVLLTSQPYSTERTIMKGIERLKNTRVHASRSSKEKDKFVISLINKSTQRPVASSPLLNLLQFSIQEEWVREAMEILFEVK